MRERNIDGQERNTHLLPLAHPQPGTWPILQACALTGNRTGDLSVHRPTLNILSHTSQGKKKLRKISFTNSRNLTETMKDLYPENYDNDKRS